MTPRAQAVFELYRDLGPGRTLDAVCDLCAAARSTIGAWSTKYEWTRLCAEHDHKEIKESLALRPIVRERVTNKLVNGMEEAAGVLLEIALDRSVLPVLDRHGEHMRGPDGDDGSPGPLLYKPVVKASTRANAAEKVLGLGGIVPVKRTEIINTTGEELDEAAAVLESMHPDDLDEFNRLMRERNAERDGDE